MRRSASTVGAVVVGGLLLAACGSGGSSTTTTTTSTTTTTTAAPAAQNLAVTASVRNALLLAGAKTHGLPASDYTGLAKGETYYAYDTADGRYWAGAALVPSPDSTQAQISAQDDGGYTLFTKAPGGTWTGYNDGLGTVPNARCSIVTPSAVRTVWGWSLTTPCGGPPG